MDGGPSSRLSGRKRLPYGGVCLAGNVSCCMFQVTYFDCGVPVVSACVVSLLV